MWSSIYVEYRSPTDVLLVEFYFKNFIIINQRTVINLVTL